MLGIIIIRSGHPDLRERESPLDRTSAAAGQHTALTPGFIFSPLGNLSRAGIYYCNDRINSPCSEVCIFIIIIFFLQTYIVHLQRREKCVRIYQLLEHEVRKNTIYGVPGTRKLCH